MKILTSLFVLFMASAAIVGCKSSAGPTSGPTHGIDANGNVWMNPPPPGEGIQMAIPPFAVPTDSEVQGDFYFTFPSNIPFSIGRIEIAMNEGTHHMNCFISPIVWPADSGQPQSMIMRKDDGSIDTQKIRYQFEWNASIVWNQSDMMIEAQIPYLNWVLPTTPDGKQTVVNLPANQRMIIENHYVNANLGQGAQQITPNGKGAVIINLWKAPAANTVPASMMVAKKTTISIPPHSDVTFTKDCRFTPSDLADTIYILGMTGHFHSRGKSFRVDKMRDSLDAKGNVVGASIVQYGVYQNANWGEPPFTGYEKPIMLARKHGEYIRYTTEYVNTLSDWTFVFGPSVRTQEHCNLFSWFVPAWHGGQTLYDNVTN